MSGVAAVPYGRLDKALHRLAFGALDVQRALGAAETRIFRGRIDAARAERPVFVTALPRAGTTTVLELLASQPEFASATYRHMPFALCPLLWRSLSGPVRRGARLEERAHRDGVRIGYDSPEAFEEILWTACWPESYETDVIEPWDPHLTDAAFAGVFQAHSAKIVAAAGPPARRYLSKNNANIARIDLLGSIFPDAAIVSPIRHPLAQAASLHRQHLRFCELHAREPFARDYMTWLGHFEFGEALKPIDFAGWTARWRTGPGGLTAAASDPSFWLDYWIAAMEAVLAAPAERLILLDFDAFCATPKAGLAALGDALGLARPADLVAEAGRLRPQPPPPAMAAPGDLIDRAMALHADASARALNAARF
ncbi:MAG: sulfotransferase [Pseudomonadota bacterium]